MSLTAGSFSARVWRVTDTLPQGFKETLERNLKRHAFRSIDLDRGQFESDGWVNIRQMLDSDLTLDKVLMGNLIVAGFRVDRLAINQKLFRATVAQEIGRALKKRRGERLTNEERLVLEDKVRLDLLKRTAPATALYEMVWRLEDGVVFFGTTAERVNARFSDLFSETFQVSIQPQFPYLRAQTWAESQGCERALLELLPSPFSPDAPRSNVE